jgi:hypothetical protein
MVIPSYWNWRNGFGVGLRMGDSGKSIVGVNRLLEFLLMKCGLLGCDCFYNGSG